MGIFARRLLRAERRARIWKAVRVEVCSFDRNLLIVAQAFKRPMAKLMVALKTPARYPQRLHDLISYKQAKPGFRRNELANVLAASCFFSMKGRSKPSYRTRHRSLHAEFVAIVSGG